MSEIKKVLEKILIFIAIIIGICFLGLVFIGLFTLPNRSCISETIDSGVIKTIYYQPRSYGVDEKWIIITDQGTFRSYVIPPVVGEKFIRSNLKCK